MDIVEVADNSASFVGEGLGVQPAQERSRFQPAVNVRHPGFNVTAQLELLPAFRYFDCPGFSRPIVDILKQVPVDRLEMIKIKQSLRRAFRYALRHQRTLDIVKAFGRRKTKFVSKDR